LRYLRARAIQHFADFVSKSLVMGLLPHHRLVIARHLNDLQPSAE
jgi:hypothetical protein